MRLKTPIVPLLALASPAFADFSLEAERGDVSGPHEIHEDSSASGGQYVYLSGEARLTGELLTSGRGVLAIGGRSHDGGSILVTIETMTGETWEDVLTFPGMHEWAELVTPDIPELTTGEETITVTVTTTGTDVEIDYVSTETCAQVFTCRATNRAWSVDDQSPFPNNPGLFDIGNNYFLSLGSGGWAAMGSDFDPSTGKSVVSGLSSAAGGAAAGPVGIAVAGGIAYVAQSLDGFYGQITLFTARYQAGKCSVDGCVNTPCKLDVEMEFKMIQANGFGSTMQFRVTRGASNPTTSTSNVAQGAANGGDTFKVTINLTASCGYYNEAYVEWGGTSWYQPAWDWLEFYLSCKNPCAYQ